MFIISLSLRAKIIKLSVAFAVVAVIVVVVLSCTAWGTVAQLIFAFRRLEVQIA